MQLDGPGSDNIEDRRSDGGGFGGGGFPVSMGGGGGGGVFTGGFGLVAVVARPGQRFQREHQILPGRRILPAAWAVARGAGERGGDTRGALHAIDRRDQVREVVLVGDDASETDGDPLRDGVPPSPGAGVVELRAQAFGPRGARRTINMTCRIFTPRDSSRLWPSPSAKSGAGGP